MSQGSLVVAGSGIKFMSHLSVEVMSYIKQSDKVIYSVNEPAMEAWIKKNNSNSESLNLFEDKHDSRLASYRAMTDYIVENVSKPQHVCVVFYGHPTVFAKSALDAIYEAKKIGYSARILPGISAEDCLYADLCIDPGTNGSLSYEATDFLIRQRPVITTSHLILWQIGIIGALKKSYQHDNSQGIALVRDYLLQFYDANHQVFVYEAALYPHMEPKIFALVLEKLASMQFSALSTLYIPPKHQANINLEILTALNITLDDIT